MNTPLEKQVHEMVKLAKKAGNEAKFQTMPQYKKFKAKYSGRQREIRLLANELFCLKFWEEVIYWSHKLFEDLRIADKEDRYTVFTMLNFSYYRSKNYEKTLEYSQKALDLQLEKPISQTVDLLDAMRDSSSKLEWYLDASGYAKEILKINVGRFNAKEITTHDILISYFNLTDLQIRAGNMKAARKTIKNLKILNLDSMDPNDVVVSMEKEGYRKLLPFHDYMNDDTLGEERKNQYIQEFLNKHCEDLDTFKELIRNLQMYHYVGKICWMKFVIHRHFDSNQNCKKWGQIHLDMLINILLHMNILEKSPDAKVGFDYLVTTNSASNVVLPYKHYQLELINSTLALASVDPINQHGRKQMYLHLYGSLLASKGCLRDIMVDLIRKYPINVMEEVMPFIHFYLKWSTEQVLEFAGATGGYLGNDYRERKMQMIMLKNSLMIMDHFKSAKET